MIDGREHAGHPPPGTDRVSRSDDRRLPSPRHPPLPALVRDADAGRLQRQSVQERDGAVRRLRGLQRRAGRNRFSAITTGVFILPFFLLSALSGQLADAADKARIIRIVKAAEIAIMLRRGRAMMAWQAAGRHRRDAAAARLVRDGGPLDLLRADQICDPAAAIGPDEVLGGTGLVEAGTYIAILGGHDTGRNLAQADGGRRRRCPDRPHRLLERAQGAARAAADSKRPS